MKPHVLIIGANGFIGRHIYARFIQDDGFDVSVACRGKRQSDFPSARSVIRFDALAVGDQELRNIVAGFDVVINAAGEIADLPLMHELNAVFPAKLAVAVSGTKAFMINISSTSVYAVPDNNAWRGWGGLFHSPPVKQISENSYEFAEDVYSMSRLKGDIFLRSFHRDRNQKAVVFRIPGVIAVDMKEAAIDLLIRVVRFGVVPIFRNDAILNYLHVDDLVEALYLAACNPEKCHSQIYIVSESISVEEVIDVLSDSLNVKPLVFRLPQISALILSVLFGRVFRIRKLLRRIKLLNNSCEFNSELIRHHLGWSPRTGLRRGLSELSRLARRG